MKGDPKDRAGSASLPGHESTVARGAAPSPARPKSDGANKTGIERLLSAMPAPDALPGYEIERELHRGGQGVVFQGVQLSTGRAVAIKIIREGAFAGPSELARFEREARLLAQLHHPNIVTVHDRSQVAGVHFLVMDYIGGQSLEEWGRELRLFEPVPGTSEGRKRLPGDDTRAAAVATFLRVFVKVCRAVQAAHERGIVHRDLKPANVRVDAEGEPHVLDFGLAKSAGVVEVEQTQTGQFLGSVPWASPEQADGATDRIQPPSDVYALGVMLYRGLLGWFPYELTSDVKRMLQRIVQDDPVRPRRHDPWLPMDLETILLKCIAKNPRERYAHAGELADDLQRYLAGDAVRARRPSLPYRIRMRARSLAARYPVGASLLLALLSGLIVYEADRAGLFFRSGADMLVRRAALAVLPDGATATPLANVRLLELTDQTPIAELAAEAGLQGVTTDINPSLRRLHGRMMTRLAAARPAVVAWDIFFWPATEYDADFVEGVRSLRAAGAEVVLGAETWQLDAAGGLPAVSSAMLRAGVRWGACCIMAEPSGPWSVELALGRAGEEPRASLALAAFAAYRQPNREFSIALDTERTALDLRYWTAPPGVPRARGWSDAADRIALTAWALEQPELSRGDLQPGDQIGVYVVSIPRPEAVKDAEVDYAEVFRGEPTSLRRKFEGRVVVVADVRGQKDRYPHPHFPQAVPGAYVHAAAIDGMQRGASPLRDSRDLGLAAMLAGLGLGALAGRVQPRRPARRAALLAGLLIAGCAVAALLCWQFSWLLNPFVALLAGLLASESIAWVERVRLAARHGH